MVNNVIPKSRARRSAVQPALSQAERQIEQVRTTLPGEGVYLVASIGDYPNMSYPPPSPDLKDLLLVPGQAVSIDELWLTSPYLVRDFQAGKVKLELVNILPQGTQISIDEGLAKGLDPKQKQFVIECTSNPFNRQFRDVICLSELLGQNGIPRNGAERVTKHWLKTTHHVILVALRDMESRKQNRQEIISLVEQQIAKIEAL